MPPQYKIAVIEDDQAIQLMYKLKLEREGFEVAAASNGRKGLELTEQFRPNLILLDLMMPEMGGADMLARLREKDWAGDIRVVILTNLGKTEAPQSLRFLHVDRYVVKAHHTPSQVVDMVREILGAPTIRQS
jgi:DNA-binding response OmpR family regulator